MSCFRVLQLNMQFGQVWDDTNPDQAPVDLARTIDEIRGHTADIVLLQEVEHAQPDGTQPQPPPNYAALRRALPQYDGCFAYPKPDARELPFGIGLAILSRAPLRDVTRVDVPSPPIPFEFGGRQLTPTDRLLLGARTMALGREVQLLNTHLLAFFMLGDGRTDDPMQRNLIAARLAQASEPTILAGDFNVPRHETLVAQFAEQGFSTVQDGEVTWRRRPYVLDHVFYNSPLRCVGHRVVNTTASDHHALVADFEFA